MTPPLSANLGDVRGPSLSDVPLLRAPLGRRKGQSVIHLTVWITTLRSFCVLAHDEKVSLQSLSEWTPLQPRLQSFPVHSPRITDVIAPPTEDI